MIGTNSYYDTGHMGANVGWHIRPGRVLRQHLGPLTRAAPLHGEQAVGLPFIIPESLWVPPLGYQSEGPLLVAAQMGMSGLDRPLLRVAAVAWDADPYGDFLPIKGNHPCRSGPTPPRAAWPIPGAPPCSAWATSSPTSPSSTRSAASSRFDRKTPIIAERRLRPQPRRPQPAPIRSIKGGVNPLAFLVGPVQVEYGGDPAKTRSLTWPPT